MKLRDIFFKVIGIGMTILLLCPTIIMSPTHGDEIIPIDENVEISVRLNPKIDIILSKARAKTDVTNFKADLENALDKYAVDVEQVKISSVSAAKVNMQTAFSWQSDIDSTIGNLTITGNGQNVEMIGNPTLPGKNAIWIEPTGNQEQTFTFNYSINFGDSFNAAGMLLRVKETDKSTHALSGYMLSFNYAGQFKSLSGSSTGAIWKFTYDGNNKTNMTISLVKALSIATSGTLTVSATDAEITVSGGGMSAPVSVEIDENYTTGNGFGFFGDHYAHGCNRIGSFKLTNINLTAVSTKSFKEILQLPDWREGSVRFMVNVDDYENEELKNGTSYSELLTKLMNEDISYVAWGNNKNQTQFENLITSNNSKGTFVQNTPYATAIDETAQYIADIVNQVKANPIRYVIVNEDTTISVDPPSIKNNTIDGLWPYGKWRVEHDYEFYENDNGQYVDSGKMVSDLIKRFEKPGKYEIFYKNKIVQPEQIYVHRKPVAQISLYRSGNNVTLTSTSYDTDEMSTPTRGISQEEWKYKTAEDTLWTMGKLTTVDSSKNYVVSLRVKDNQEAWSDPTTLYITSDTTSLPVAAFTITNSTIAKYEELGVNDNSYDPSGANITTRTWEVYKDDKLVYSGSTPKTNYRDSALGEYTLYLTVKNSRNATSEKFGRKFVLIDDTTAPEVVINPTDNPWKTGNQTVNVKFTDQGKSGVKHYKYAITNSQNTPTTWSSAIAKTEDTITITGNGENYLHIIAEDNAGNISEDRVAGPYRIDNAKPTIGISADFANINIDALNVSINLKDVDSGIKVSTLNGEDISSGVHKFTRNGTFTIYVEDNVGNNSSETFTINNIYYECPKNIGHPIYTSTLDKCPVCEAYEGLTVTETTKTYNQGLQGVTYENPTEIVVKEYYNEINNQVIDANTYDYELHVMYNGIEYRTENVGKFVILPKELTITEIHAESRPYDTTKKIKLSNGILNGIIEGDQVERVLAEYGDAETKEPGNWKVTVPEILIVGKDAKNYILTQPEYGSVTVEITEAQGELAIASIDKTYDNKPVQVYKASGNNQAEIEYTYYNHGETTPLASAPTKVGMYDVEGHQESDGEYTGVTSEKVTFEITKRDIRINNLSGEERPYDTTKIVNIIGGKLVNTISGDKVTPVIPKTGEIESKEPGTWKVSIGEITLDGEDARNYNLIQPSYGEVKGVIVLAQGELEINCENKVYDNQPAAPYRVNGNNVSDVEYIYYNYGETEPLASAPTKVGKYEVAGYQESDGEYTEVTSARVVYEITPKIIHIVGVKGATKPFDTTPTMQMTKGRLNGIIGNDEVRPVVPATGEAESIEPGIWKIKIDDITLQGQDAYNYELEQPDSSVVIGEIVFAKGSLTIDVEDKVYDNLPNIPHKTAGNNNSNIKYIYYNHGEDEALETAPTKIGVYDVEGQQRNDGRYTGVISEKVTFEITPKEITISEITSETRAYDGTTIVKLTGGKLNDAYVEDYIYPILPETGETESAEPGIWKISLGEISLAGPDAENYILKQPEYGEATGEIIKAAGELEISCENKIYDNQPAEPYKVSGNNVSDITYVYYNKGENTPLANVPTKVGIYEVEGHQESDGEYTEVTSEKVTFEITKRDITVTGLYGEERHFDKTDIVKIVGGTLENAIEGDQVSLKAPKTGTTEDKKAGTWKVAIDEVAIEGKDAYNYNLIQPEYGDVQATITLAPTILQVASENKVYDNQPAEPYKAYGDNQSEIEYIYYNYGENEPLSEAPTKVGKYEVEGHQENDGEYAETTSEKAIYEITPKTIHIVGVKGQTKPFDTTPTMQMTTGRLNGIVDNDEVRPVVPATGEAESTEPGIWEITLDEITLQGKDAYNYQLEQPQHETVIGKIVCAKGELTIDVEDKVYDNTPNYPWKTDGNNNSQLKFRYYNHEEEQELEAVPTKVGIYDVEAYQSNDGRYTAVKSNRVTFEITPKEITVSEIIGETKPYDGNTTVKLINGKLNDTYEEDEVSPVLPETGEAESAEPGIWKIKVDENITLGGPAAYNYTLTQPEYGEITGEITLAEGKLEIACENRVYDNQASEPHQVSGNNVSNITYTYYNHGEITPLSEAPTKAGIYDVQGHQESDGQYTEVTSEKATYEITRKEITITDIYGEEREFDGTNTVKVLGGKLVGVLDGDDVTAKVPATGTAEESKAGTWKVSIKTIRLLGMDAKNYSLIQPEYGEIEVTIDLKATELEIACDDKIYDNTVAEPYKANGKNKSEVEYTYYNYGENEPLPSAPTKVGKYEVQGHQANDGEYAETTSEKVTYEITPKTISVVGIKTERKTFDKTNTINIISGRLEGVEEGDNVEIIMPKTGEAESDKPGVWKVAISDVAIQGEDAYNYEITQPEYGKIIGEIEYAPGILEISAQGKVYDTTTVIPTKVSGNNNSEIKYTYFNHGETKALKTAPTKAGKYDVEGYQRNDGETMSVTSPKVTFEITPKEITISDIKGETKEFDGTKTVKLSGGKLTGVYGKEDVRVKLPATGTAESAEPGIWKISVSKISLEGNDASNYTLKQPTAGTIKGEITLATTTLEIECPDKVYDGNSPEPVKAKGDNSSKVEYAYYNYGEKEPLASAPTKVGKYEVEGRQEKDNRYLEVTSPKVAFEITQKHITATNIKAEDKEFDKTNVVKLISGTLEGVLEGDEVELIMPVEGKSKGTDLGTWDVTVEKLEIQGEDAENYILDHSKDDVVAKVEILAGNSKLEISCGSKEYDGTPIEPEKIGGNNPSEIKYVYYKHGETTPMDEAPTEPGNYEVEGYQEAEGEHSSTKSKKVTFSIYGSPPKGGKDQPKDETEKLQDSELEKVLEKEQDKDIEEDVTTEQEEVVDKEVKTEEKPEQSVEEKPTTTKPENVEKPVVEPKEETKVEPNTPTSIQEILLHRTEPGMQVTMVTPLPVMPIIPAVPEITIKETGNLNWAPIIMGTTLVISALGMEIFQRIRKMKK